MPLVNKVFQLATRMLWGTGIGKLPGVYAVYSYLSKKYGSKDPIIVVQGSKMNVDTAGLSDSFIKTFDAYRISPVYGWEELTTELFKSVVKLGDVVLDLGANIGYYTLLASRLVRSQGHVYAFEPEPTNFSLLNRNIDLNNYTNITTYQKAVSSKSGTMKFFVNTKDTGAHSLYDLDMEYGASSRRFITVDVVTLDELLPNLVANVVKMDIEGAELPALAGMKGIIARSPNLKFFMELCTSRTSRIGYTLDEVYDVLRNEYSFNIKVIEDFCKQKNYSTSHLDKTDFVKICNRNKVVTLFLEKQ